MSKKPTCVFSEPVQISLDELMTELLRRMPEEELANALRVATVNACKRSNKSRHNRYKVERAFRKMAERLVNVPDDLSVVVGLKEASQLELPIAEKAAAPSPNADDYSSVFDLPTFDTFKHVFDKYPYASVYRSTAEGLFLVLGYASGRDGDNRLIRRNCVIVHPNGTETNFTDLPSVYGKLSQDGAVHRYIKVYPFKPGLGIRFWTNVAGVGDATPLNRFLVTMSFGRVVPVTSREEMLAVMAREKTSPEFPNVATPVSIPSQAPLV